MSASRTDRLGEQIKVEASDVLAREVHDPGVGFVTLTRVQRQPRHAGRPHLLHGAGRRGRAAGDRQGAPPRDAVRPAPARAETPLAARAGDPPSCSTSRLPIRRVSRSCWVSAQEIAARPDAACHTNDAPEPVRPTTGRSEGEAATPSRASASAIHSRQRSSISSHARPDGDSIGSQLAMAFALRALGKHVEVVNKDAAPPALMAFPGVPSIRVADRVDDQFDAAIIMECSDLGAPASKGSTSTSSSTSITIPATRTTARSTGSRRALRPARRWCST